METWLLLPVVLSGITLILWLLSSPFYWTTRKVKHLTPLPIFGNSLPVITLGNVGYMQYLYNKFPGEKYFGFHMLTRPALFVKDPEIIHKIRIKDFDYFTSKGMYSNQDRDQFGTNLLYIHGQQWRERRAKISPHFTPRKVKAMLSSAETTINKINGIIDENIMNNQPIEMLNVFMKTSIDILTQSIFGIKSDIFENDNSFFNKLAKEVSSFSFNLGMSVSMISPKLYDLLRLTSFSETFTACLKNIVLNTMAYRKKENLQRADFLQGMIELLKSQEAAKDEYCPDNAAEHRFDINSVIAESLLLFAAGTETSATGMSFCLYELAVNPNIQDACRREVLSLIKKEGCDEITAELATELPYLSAVVKESLRLHSPLVLFPVECTRDYKVPGSDLTISKGQLLILSPNCLHLSDKYFPQPNAFKPERFLSDAPVEGMQGCYFPFGLGPRACPGINFARVEMNLILSRLLQNYKFSVCSRTEVPVKYSLSAFMTTPANGIWLSAQRLESASNDR